jgi:hypothetical protein
MLRNANDGLDALFTSPRVGAPLGGSPARGPASKERGIKGKDCGAEAANRPIGSANRTGEAGRESVQEPQSALSA